MSLSPWILIPLLGVAGGIGSVLRVYLMRWHGALPFGLILTNTIAAACVGVALSAGDFPQGYLVIALAGFAGGLSTFAGVSKSAWEFWHNGRLVQMLLTLITNLLLPILALMLALWGFAG